MIVISHIPAASNSKLAAVQAYVAHRGELRRIRRLSACAYAPATLPTIFFFFLFHSLNLLRGKGPLKNSSDVINAAKKIAEAGSRMDKLARAVADQVALELHLYLSLSFFAIMISISI